ncbi:MAG: ATP-binding protein [Acidobacteriota bacterium]|jgi:predicted AAA+ superfamily ATPase|nr:ATP-binding protein [Acidobacteriota bacterium]
MAKEYARWQKDLIRKTLKARRVVVISGPRQSGKTTLAKQVATKKDVFRTLDNDALLRVALSDPSGFVRHAEGTMIIDEIQKAPLLLTAIKQAVDENSMPGQFLLTGSADIRTLPAVSDSLAGRISHMRLRTLTMGELLDKRPSFFERAFTKDWPSQIKGYDKAAIVDLAFRGGYPEVVKLPITARERWHADYAERLLNRDLRDIANIQRQGALRSLLDVLAAWSGKLMDIAGICGKLSVSRKTVESYINALLALHLFERLPPWLKTDYDRVGRREKIFATDTGFMASLLQWRMDNILLDADRSGKIVETFVFNELAAQIDLYDGYRFYHYRDRQNREIDFIVENDRGELLGMEVKAGSLFSTDDCRHMVWFKNNIVPDKPFTGIVLHSGQDILPLGGNMYAVPIAALWEL